jgi:hypothetical protein
MARDVMLVPVVVNGVPLNHASIFVLVATIEATNRVLDDNALLVKFGAFGPGL